MNNKTVIKRQGLMRLIFTLSHTFNGLKWMSRFEAAFQQELVLFSLLGVFACLQEITLSSKFARLFVVYKISNFGWSKLLRFLVTKKTLP